MRVIGELKLASVWLNPAHTAQAARVLMTGMNLRFLPVMEGTLLMGVVTLEQVRAVDGDVALSELLDKVPLVLESQTPIHKAAAAMSDAGADIAAVISEDRFQGLLCSTMLLKHLLRPWDARTNLGSGERLRDWGTEMLREGREISILFIDLNDFKEYNSQHGHVFGDRVLRRVANFLRESSDEKRDLLVRYGGDEFAIGSLRDRSSAEDLARSITDRAETELFDDEGRPITFCIGVSGGRRSAIRDGLHPDATYDDLVTAASKACLQAKLEMRARRKRPMAEVVEDEPERRR